MFADRGSLPTRQRVSARAVLLFPAIPSALERFIDQGYVRQDVAHSAVGTGMCRQRGPADDEPFQSGDSHSEAGKERFGTFALFKSTYPGQDVAISAVGAGTRPQRGPAGDEPLQSGDSHTEAGRERFGTFALFKST